MPLVAQRWTRNAEAYAYFLTGREKYFDVDGPQPKVEARPWFEKALQLDPNYAPALCGLARIYATELQEGRDSPGRFEKAPKPMYYPEGFLTRLWHEYLADQGATADQVDPDAFIRHGFRALMAHRLPRYAAMAARWGVTVEAAEVAEVRDPQDFDALVAEALGRRR